MKARRKVSAAFKKRAPGPLQEESTKTAQGSIPKQFGVSFELIKVYPKSLVQRVNAHRGRGGSQKEDRLV